MRAELDLPASLDGRLQSGTPGAIRQKNLPEDCYKTHQRFANARANKALP
jgi:hypothetical protein